MTNRLHGGRRNELPTDPHVVIIPTPRNKSHIRPNDRGKSKDVVNIIAPRHAESVPAKGVEAVGGERAGGGVGAEDDADAGGARGHVEQPRIEQLLVLFMGRSGGVSVVASRLRHWQAAPRTPPQARATAERCRPGGSPGPRRPRSAGLLQR